MSLEEGVAVVQHDAFDLREIGFVDLSVLQLCRFLIVMRSNPVVTRVVYLPRLELCVQDVGIRGVAEHHPVGIGAVAEIGFVRVHGDALAGNALAPLERTGSDRSGVEGSGIRVLGGAQGVLRNHEGPRQQRDVGRIGLRHLPRYLVRIVDRDVADESVSLPGVGSEGWVVQQLQRIFDVLGREFDPVVPTHALPEFDVPCEPVGGDAAVVQGGHLCCKLGDEATIRICSPEGLNRANQTA